MDPNSTTVNADAASEQSNPSTHVEHHVKFDLATQVTELHIGWSVSGTRIDLAQLIDPAQWGINPEGGRFFKTAQWVDDRPGALQYHRGMFREHLEFWAGGDLMRSVENLLWIEFTGLDGREDGSIASTFDLHESVDDLLAIDRGWFVATPPDDGIVAHDVSAEWSVEMKKFVRFRDPVNTGLAPVLLASWAEAAWPDVIRAAQDQTDREETRT